MRDLAERPTIAGRPWLTRDDPGVPATLDYPAVRLDALLRRTTGRYPERAALIFVGRSTSYRALADAVDRVATGLRRLGLTPGERVALFMPNCPQLVIGLYAVWRAGGVAVPMNPRSTGAEFTRSLSDSGAAAAIVLDQLWLGLKDPAVPLTLRHLVVADVADALPLPMRIGALITRRGVRAERLATGTPRIVTFEALAREHADAMPPLVGSADPAVLLYTGGTTGLPKAAILTHRNMVANACQLGAWASGLDDGAGHVVSPAAGPRLRDDLVHECLGASGMDAGPRPRSAGHRTTAA